MTRISISLAAASLTLSLAPAANAYQTIIETGLSADNIVPINVLFSDNEVAPDGTCSTDITPVLAAALGLTNEDGTPNDALLTQMACNNG